MFFVRNCSTFGELTVIEKGIRAVPNIGNQGFAGSTNLAILRYKGARNINPSSDPTQNIPQSVLPLKETDLHVGFFVHGK